MSTFKFSMPLKVRIGDINYGNHVGHETFFSYFQEARIAYLSRFGFSEIDIGGCGRTERGLDTLDTQCCRCHAERRTACRESPAGGPVCGH